MYVIQQGLTLSHRYHCLFCHGYEERGADSAGLLALGHLEMSMMAIFVSRFANRLAKKVTIYTNNNVVAAESIHSVLADLKPTSKTAQNVTIETRAITKFVKKDTQNAAIEVHFDDGTFTTEGFLAHAPNFELSGNWDKKLGLEVLSSGQIKVNAPFNETSMQGVFAAGDCALVQAAVAPALCSAAAVAAGLCAQLGAED